MSSLELVVSAAVLLLVSVVSVMVVSWSALSLVLMIFIFTWRRKLSDATTSGRSMIM